MQPDERQGLRRLYEFRCGYCGVRESDAGSELTVDHFQPRSKGGTHEMENWVYACHACNEFKSDYWQPRSPRHLLHPLRDPWPTHVAEDEDGTLRGLTETGAFHIDWLHLNRRQLVAYRRERRLLQVARQNQTHLLDELRHLDEQVKSILAQLAQLRER